MNGSGAVRVCVCAFLFVVLPVPAEDTPEIAVLRADAEKGDATAQHNLGVCYELGTGVSKDQRQAAEWYRKAAEQGHAEAQCDLGSCYNDGAGVPKNQKQAAEWYRKAAELGWPEAQQKLGDCYAFGTGLPKNTNIAFDWYLKASEQGVAEAQCRLGFLYAGGDGVPKDMSRAAEWYLKAAEQGHARAQNNLGVLYMNGTGVMQDFVKAYMWFNISSLQYAPPLTENRDGIAQRMTPQQIAEAQRLSSAFTPKQATRERNRPSAANLGTPTPDKLAGSGTGFFVTTDGWLVTNAHVATVGVKALVKLGETLFSAVVRQVDKANDLALIKVEGQFECLAIERARRVALGASVFTVGFPNPGLQGFSPKMTKGEISSLAGIKDDPRYFQISAPIQPGNSGGALADESGNVVGVVSAMISDKAAIETTGAIPQNVNYAVKSNYLLALVESIPDAAKGLMDPVKTQDFAAAVQAVEKASAMVLMFE